MVYSHAYCDMSEKKNCQAELPKCYRILINTLSRHELTNVTSTGSLDFFPHQHDQKDASVRGNRI